MEVTAFCLNVACYFANKHTKHRNYHLAIETSPSVHKTIGSVHQKDQYMAQNIQPSIMHADSIHEVCHGIGCHVIYGSFLYILKVKRYYQEECYYSI